MRRLFILLAFAALPAAAQNNRSFVSTSGNDANLCTAGNECRTFARALSVTNPGGEVLALTSGGYGAFTISQAVTVVATTGDASITTSGANGVNVTASSTDRVVLRGLNVTVLDGISNGINATGFGLLSIENCSSSGGSVGIYVGGAAASRASLERSSARNASVGFDVLSPVTMNGCRAEHNSSAGVAVALSEVADGVLAAKDLVSSGNGSGVSVAAPVMSHVVTAFVDHAQVANNTGDGFVSNAVPGSIARLFITNSSSTGNSGYGLNGANGTIYSMKNNSVAGNVTGDTNGAISTLSSF